LGERRLILLDTHAMIWYASGVRMKPSAMRAIGGALEAEGALVSAISAWEIGMLIKRSRLLVAQDSQTYVGALFSSPGIVEEPVTAAIAEFAARLPGDFHGDPADRIIVATAALRSASVVTRDARILEYAKRTRLVPAITC
jgi:PIN domain nuclease of toxin-antitoxin system